MISLTLALCPPGQTGLKLGRQQCHPIPRLLDDRPCHAFRKARWQGIGDGFDDRQALCHNIREGLKASATKGASSCSRC